MKPISKAIYCLVKAITDSNDSQQIKALNNATTQLLQVAGNIHPSGVSIAAKKLAKLKGINDLREFHWHEQNKFDKGRKLFHLEHYVTISCLRAECMAAKNEDEVLHIITKRIRLYWILKKEDKRLTKNGHRINRPNPKEAYKKANIKTIKPKSGWLK
jgi:hypothetical protein